MRRGDKYKVIMEANIRLENSYLNSKGIIFESEIIDEKINLKNLAAGAMMALATSCNNLEVNDVNVPDYSGDMLVKRIEILGRDFVVHGVDSEGKNVDFNTDNLTFNVGDSIHVDASEEKAYPLSDKENVSKFVEPGF